MPPHRLLVVFLESLVAEPRLTLRAIDALVFGHEPPGPGAGAGAATEAAVKAMLGPARARVSHDDDEEGGVVGWTVSKGSKVNKAARSSTRGGAMSGELHRAATALYAPSVARLHDMLEGGHARSLPRALWPAWLMAGHSRSNATANGTSESEPPTLRVESDAGIKQGQSINQSWSISLT